MEEAQWKTNHFKKNIWKTNINSIQFQFPKLISFSCAIINWSMEGREREREKWKKRRANMSKSVVNNVKKSNIEIKTFVLFTIHRNGKIWMNKSNYRQINDIQCWWKKKSIRLYINSKMTCGSSSPCYLGTHTLTVHILIN